MTRASLKLPTLAAVAAGAAAARRTRGRAPGLVALPLFDRLAAESPVAADAEAGQPSLPEQTVDRRRMHPQMFRQFLDGKNLIALSCLSHILSGFAWRRRFLRRRFAGRSFFHSLRRSDVRFQFSASVVVLAESRHFVQVQVEAACERLPEHQNATSKELSMQLLAQF
jgi:hypothetical protein